MLGRADTSVLVSELKLYLLTWTLNVISWKIYVIAWVLWDHYHSFKMVQKAFEGVFKKEDIFKKIDKLSVFLNYMFMIWLYRLIFELCYVLMKLKFDEIKWLSTSARYTTLKFITKPQSTYVNKLILTPFSPSGIKCKKLDAENLWKCIFRATRRVSFSYFSTQPQ